MEASLRKKKEEERLQEEQRASLQVGIDKSVADFKKIEPIPDGIQADKLRSSTLPKDPSLPAPAQESKAVVDTRILKERISTGDGTVERYYAHDQWGVGVVENEQKKKEEHLRKTEQPHASLSPQQSPLPTSSSPVVHLSPPVVSQQRVVEQQRVEKERQLLEKKRVEEQQKKEEARKKALEISQKVSTLSFMSQKSKQSSLRDIFARIFRTFFK